MCVAAALLFSLKDFRLFAIRADRRAPSSLRSHPARLRQRFVSMFDTKDPTRRDRVAMLWEGERMIVAQPVDGRRTQHGGAALRRVSRGPDAVSG